MMPTFIMLITALVTAAISGIFGMAGGMIFMAVITLYLCVAEAMVVHGAVQSVSNFSRSVLLKPHIRWDVLFNHLIGALPVIVVLGFISFVPEKRLLYLILGLLPFLLWLPRGWFQGDAENPLHAIFCGAMVIALNISAGVAGPALDFFYVKTAMTRQEIVATKAVTMFFSHIVKIVYFGLPILLAANFTGLPGLWFFAAAIPCVFIGTFLGTRILLRLQDVNFKAYTRYLVTAIGVYYLCRAAGIFSDAACAL